MARRAVILLILIATVALFCATQTPGQAQTDWQMFPDPVVRPTQLPAWEDGGIAEEGGVIWVGDLHHYLMSYEAMPAGGTGTLDRRTGIASSPDGIHWYRFAGNPVLRSQQLPPLPQHSRNSCLLYDPDDLNAPYKMWFDTSGSILGSKIWYTTSNDAIHWKVPVVVLQTGPPGSYDSYQVFQPQVVKVKGTYYMYYSARNGPPQTVRGIGVATWDGTVPDNWLGTSSHTWQHVGTALPQVGTSEWDYQAGCPDVVYVPAHSTLWPADPDGHLLMFYKGLSYSGTPQPAGLATCPPEGQPGFGTTFTRYSGNPIVSPTTNPAVWPYQQTTAISVILNGTHLEMWFASILTDGSHQGGVGRAVSAPNSAVSWTVDPAPVLTGVTPNSAFDAGNPHPPSAIKCSSNDPASPPGCEWVMYYEGFATRNPSTQSSVGLARSPDGVNWFKYSGNPVVQRQGSEDRVGQPSVIYEPSDPDGKIWWMYYFRMVRPDGTNLGNQEIVRCRSADGYTWTWDTGPPLYGAVLTVPGTNLLGPDVHKAGGVYYMYTHDGNQNHMYLSTSGVTTPPDGLHWSAPAIVLSRGGPGTADEHGVADTSVVVDGAGLWHMWYRGDGAVGAPSICYASSSDGTNWNKYAGNPVLPGTGNLTIFPYTATAPTVVLDNDIYYMWFNGGWSVPQTLPHPGLGYAVSAVNAAVIPTPASSTPPPVENPSVGVSVQFGDVETAGQTVIAEGSAPPGSADPPGYLITGGTYFSVSTTAGYVGEVELTVTYDDTGMTLAQEQAQRLMHWNEATATWEDITIRVDTVPNHIVGRTRSLSMFAQAQGTAQVIEARDGQAQPGQTGTVLVQQQHAWTGARVEFDLAYNIGRAGLLTLSAVRAGAALPAGWTLDSTPAADSVHIYAYSPTNTMAAGEAGPLVELDFTVNPAAAGGESCTLHPQNIVVYDDTATPLPDVSGADGSFTVMPAPVPPVVASAGPDHSIAVGGSVGIGGAPSASSGVPPYTYSWNHAASLNNATIANPTASPTTTTVYTLTVTDSIGQQATDSVTVSVGLTANAGPDKAVLSGGSAVLEGLASGGIPPYTYSWTPTSYLDLPHIAQPSATNVLITTTYTLTVTDSTMATATDSTTLTVQPAPKATTLVLNSVSPASVTVGSSGPVALTATLTRNDTSAGVAGATVAFSVDGNPVGTAVTGAGGVGTLNYDPSALAPGSHTVQASFAGEVVGGIAFLASTSNTLALTCVYNFIGFLPPVDNPPVFNAAKAGRTIPVKWQLKDANGAFISSLSVVVYNPLRYRQIADDGAPIDPLPADADTAGATVLRYDSAANQFIFNWKTSSTFAGKCYELILDLNDGTQKAARFKFTK